MENHVLTHECAAFLYLNWKFPVLNLDTKTD